MEATFYFDLGSPYAYLTAERIEAVIAGPIDWQPISLGALFKLNGRSSWSLAGAERRREGIAEVERRALAYGLAPVRWPDPWPGNYLAAMRAATYAKQVGRVREFALEAFRVGFRDGLDLSEIAHVRAAAARAGLDPAHVETSTSEEHIKLALREATDAAHARGVIGVPTIIVGDELYWGDDRLQEASRREGDGDSR